jgi:hypothetical protein
VRGQVTYRPRQPVGADASTQKVPNMGRISRRLFVGSGLRGLPVRFFAAKHRLYLGSCVANASRASIAHLTHRSMIAGQILGSSNGTPTAISEVCNQQRIAQLPAFINSMSASASPTKANS